MDNTFDIEIIFNNQPLSFPAEFLSSGYTYKINVDVKGQLITFEPDEERNFRAIIPYDEAGDSHKIDKEMVEAIALQLMALFKDS
jgi:hypothetical protein